jgi:vanillate/3-O-methylgallate O-demethylase
MEFSMQEMRSRPARRPDRWGQPEFTDWMDESLSWKQTCYIGDWSFLWQHRVTGPDALRLLADISVNTFENFGVGQSKHVIHTNRNGKVMHEGVVTRFGPEDLVVHGRGGFWISYWLQQHDYAAAIAQEDWFIFQVSGPTSLQVLDAVIGPNRLRDTRRMWVEEIQIAGHRVHALRQGMAGEVGFELQGPRAAGQEVWDTVFEAGQAFGMRRLGGRVSAINHLEADFPTQTREYMPAIFDEDMTGYRDFYLARIPSLARITGSYDGRSIQEYYRSPVELGWARNIRFDHDFLGREALEAEVAAPRRIIRTLVWEAADVVDVYASLFEAGEHYAFMDMPRDQRDYMWADEVRVDGDVVGVSTSRGYSYWFRQMLSLCVIDVAHAEIGTPVTITWGAPGTRQKQIRATVAPAPYKPDRSRGDLRDASA